MPIIHRMHARLRASCTVLACVLVAGGSASAAPASPSPHLAQQRVAFRAAWTAAQNGQDWRPLARGLDAYPLYPYLESVALQRTIKTADAAQIDAYLARYPGLIPATALRRATLNYAASQKDWQTFMHFYQPGLGTALTCDALQARLAQGTAPSFDRYLAALWQNVNLPAACTPILDAAFVAGLLTPARVWARIEHAADAPRASAIRQAAKWLTGADAAAAQRIAQAIEDPSTLLQQASSFSNTARNREAIARALARLARRQHTQAQSFWQSLAPQFTFSGAQRNRILAALALYNAVDAGPDAAQRLAALPAAAQTDATRQWRARAAVAAQDWNAAAAAIAALPPAAMEHDEWRYWQARVEQKRGHEQRARDAYMALAHAATFYGFLAADRAGVTYSICPATVPLDSLATQQLDADPGLRRAFEFFALALLPQARREWHRAFADLAPAQQRQAAALATQRGWYDRAVFALGKPDDSHYYALRFPLADKARVLAASQAAGIAPAWTFAIIRAETAWQTDARSGANARGLMQLLPATARQVARRTGLPYAGAGSLADPAINIALGTHYLAHLGARFDQSPWLTTAAYNAGPGNVGRWLARRGTLDPERFILTIPFPETRAYVTRVLSFATVYDWRLHDRTQAVSSRLPAIGTPYTVGTPGTRKPVACRPPESAPATVAPAASARSPSA